MAPIALDRDSVSAEVVEKEKEIAREKARQEGKPEAILDKIAEGRLNKFYQESVLLEQASIAEDAGKDSVAAYLKKNNATCIAFKRVTLNEE
jgi:elongation factor Ts